MDLASIPEDVLANFPEALCLIDASTWRVVYSNRHGPLQSPGPIRKLMPRIRAFYESGRLDAEETYSFENPRTHYRAKLSRGADHRILLGLTDVTNDIILEEKMFQRGEELSILYELG